MKDFSDKNAGQNVPPGNGDGMMANISILPIMGSMMPMSNDNNGITELMTNYNEKYKNAGPAMFREGVIKQIFSILIGKDKPNALLIGPAGAGKTKIVEDIAAKLANDDPLVPKQLKNFTIWELPVASMIAGTSMHGAMEERVLEIIEFAKDPENKAILFIDEIHQLANSRMTSTQQIAQILKPAMSRGDIRMIGATTTQEAKTLASDPAFSRRFTQVFADEPTREQTFAILKHILPEYTAHYEEPFLITDDVLERITVIADQYTKAGSHRPDTAITLLDRSMGDAIIKKQILIKNAKNNPQMANAVSALNAITLTEKNIKQTALRLMTGHSRETEFNEEALRKALSEIKGQNGALEILIKKLKSNARGLYQKNTPVSFLLAGGTGTGKTQAAKILAKTLTEMPLISLNMTEFHSPASINRIIGAPAGYVGHSSNRELPFDSLETNPYQVVLLDELEKADKSVQTLFMQALEEGFIKTATEKVIDFSKAIVIATTNAANKGLDNKIKGFSASCGKDSDDGAEISPKALSKWFDLEFLNRFGVIIGFAAIGRDTYQEILRDVYAKDAARIKMEHPDISLPEDFPEDDLNRITEETYVPEFNARPAAKAVREYIESIA